MSDVIRKTFENSITLVRVSDGESASSYSIDTNYNEILKFVRKTDDGGEELDFSPPSLEFKVFDFLSGKHLTDFHWNLSYLSDSEFVTIAERNENNYQDYFVYETLDKTAVANEEKTESSSGISETSLTFRIAAFYKEYKNTDNEKEKSFIQAISENAPLKFVCFDDTDNRILATKIITIQNGVSADMAKLNIGATGIVASIRDAGLRFDANGLTVQNGSFVIEREYIRAEPQPSKSEFSQAEYYYKTDDGSREGYTKATEYEVGVVYYIKADETNKKLLYADDDGNLAIVGSIYADNGYFRGEVHATSGTFEGAIKSKQGQIGGFEISDYSITSINGTIQLRSQINSETNQDESEILAGKITIKEGYLTDRIVIQADTSDEHGRVVLSNPTTNEGKVLESGTLILKSNGYLQLGNIEMYGGGQSTLDGYIRSTFTDEAGLKQNGFWQINENGTAHFDQIYANNARIKDSVLEINTIQTVGSLMLFKDSWPVVKIETYEADQEEYPGSQQSARSIFTASVIYIEGRPDFDQGDYLYANDHYYLVERATTIRYYDLVEEVEVVDGKEQVTYNYTPTNDRVFQSNKKYFMEEGQDHYVPVEYSNFITMIELRSLIDENDTIVTKIGKIKNQEVAIFAETFKTGVQYYRFNKISEGNQNTGSFYEQFSTAFVNSYDSSFIEGKNYYWKEKLEINSPEEFDEYYNDGNIYIASTNSEGGQMLSILGESRKESGTGIQDFAVGNSLTISEISDLGGRLGFVKHLILGDLTETGIDILTGMGGWGLYCDNVYLNGALATRDVETYAGINTKSGVQFSQNKEGQEQQDRSNIVFWGGANGIDEASIQKAKFQVTAGGTLYAQDAIIENSIFSGADIYSARLFTAEIHGNNGSLSIYDSSNGVVFKKEVDGVASEIYTLKDGGFFLGNNAFVTIPNAGGAVRFNGDFLSSDSSKQVGLKNGFIAFSHGTEGAGVAEIEFQILEQNSNVSALQFTIDDGFNGKPQLELRAGKMTIETEASFESNVWLTNKMQYQKVSNGYDLYVYE